MSTLNDLRRVADEMETLIDGGTNYPVTMRRLTNTIREFTATPRCPMCGTSVRPIEVMGHSTYGTTCRACKYKGPRKYNEQDAIAAFYGEEE